MEKTVAIYPGRFQPFGPHHYEAYKLLANKFGVEDTYIATSDKTDPERSPFTFEEKKQIAMSYGIPGDKIVQVKSPYQPKEVLDLYQEDTPAIFLLGEKDATRLQTGKMKKDGTPGYFAEYNPNMGELEGWPNRGYVIIAPNISKNIPGVGEMSGTNIRQAIRSGIPMGDIFGDLDVRTLNMIQKKFQPQDLNEGRYDTISNKISSDIFRYWKDNVEDGEITFKGTYQHESEDINVEATLEVTPEVEYLEVDGGADDKTNFIAAFFKVNPSKLPKYWSEISFNLKDVIRHEIEHLTHGDSSHLKFSKYMKNDELIRQSIDAGLLSGYRYFELEKEIDANLQGMYFRAKKEKRPFKDLINTYLDAQNITAEEKEGILNLWRKRNKALNLPLFEDESSLKEEIVGNKIVCNGLKFDGSYKRCNWSWDIEDGGDDLYMCHKCGHNNEPLNEAVGDKTLYAFDLDDTLITSKSNIIVTNPERGTFQLTPAEYSLYTPGPDDELDFSEFASLNEPKVIPEMFNLFSQILTKTSKLPNAKTIILTARQPEVISDVKEFLSNKGLADLKVHAVGSSDPMEKVKVILDYIEDGYKKIRFYDDSPKNVRAVKTLDKTTDAEVKSQLISLHEMLFEFSGGAIMNKQETGRHKKKLAKLRKHMEKQGSHMIPYPDLPKTVFGGIKLFEGFTDEEQKYWAFHYDLFKKLNDAGKKYEELYVRLSNVFRNKPKRRKALEYFKNFIQSSEKIDEMYPPYKANMVQKTRYKASDVWTNDPNIKETKLFSKNWWTDILQESIIEEGGNIFKDQDKKVTTIRINKADVDPTLKWLENIVGLDLLNNKLGSTGIKTSSGDLDIAINQEETTKDEILNKLADWAKQNHPEDDVKQWTRKTGISVHFKTPIRGDESNGYVQTDLMFGNPEWMKFALKGTGDDTVYKGVHRLILMASIAKSMGMKYSTAQGLVDRESNEVISNSPEEIATRLLGKGAKPSDLDNVESIYAKIKGHPNYEAMIADAKGNFNFKEIPPEKNILQEGARIDHAEDIVFWEGSKGALRAVDALRNLEKGGHKEVTIKWDGSPAIIFGRDENGDFILTDKNGYVAKGYDGKTKSADDLEKMLLSRGKEVTDSRRQFAGNMKSIFDEYEKAVPQDYRGLFKGDLLYYNTPPVKDKNFIFKPNIVQYAVDVDSDLGNKIGKSKTGVVIHRQVDPEGNESPLRDPDIFLGDEVLVVPPITAEKAPDVPNKELDRLEAIAKKDATDIDTLLNQDTLRKLQISDFSKILYAYTNSKVDTGLDNLGKDFEKWLAGSKVSQRKQGKITEYIAQNPKAFESLWEVVGGIMQAKDHIIDQLDKQGSNVKQSIGGQEGGEGYVLAHPGGDIKLVPRATFSKANRAVQRT